MGSSEELSSFISNDYLSSRVLESIKLFSMYSNDTFRSRKLQFSVTVCEKILDPQVEVVDEEVIYKVHDDGVWIFVVFSKQLEDELLFGNHACSQNSRRNLNNHLLLLVEFDVELRANKNTGCPEIQQMSYVHRHTSRCPSEFQIVFRTIIATCRCLSNGSGSDSSSQSASKKIWYYDHPVTDLLIKKIISRNKREESALPPCKQPKTVIINFDETRYFRPQEQGMTSLQDTDEDGSSSWPMSEVESSPRRSWNFSRSHISESPPLPVSQIVVLETPVTSPEAPSSVRSSFGSDDHLITQRFTRTSFSDQGTPNSSGSEFGGTLLLNCISDAKREVYDAKYYAQRRPASRIVVEETDLEDFYEPELF